jgi:carboxylesterase type B
MSEIVTVSVAQGKLRGREATTKSGGTYYSFQGIPYAKPPVGPLRFKVSLKYFLRKKKDVPQRLKNLLDLL